MNERRNPSAITGPLNEGNLFNEAGFPGRPAFHEATIDEVKEYWRKTHRPCMKSICVFFYGWQSKYIADKSADIRPRRADVSNPRWLTAMTSGLPCP